MGNLTGKVLLLVLDVVARGRVMGDLTGKVLLVVLVVVARGRVTKSSASLCVQKKKKTLNMEPIRSPDVSLAHMLSYGCYAPHISHSRRSDGQRGQ